MVAVDAIVVYIQSTPNFPSWHPRAFSPRKSMKVGQQVTELVAAQNVFRPWTSRFFHSYFRRSAPGGRP